MGVAAARVGGGRRGGARLRPVRAATRDFDPAGADVAVRARPATCSSRRSRAGTPSGISRSPAAATATARARRSSRCIRSSSRLAGAPLGSALVGGALASTALLGVALVLLHRLVALDHDRAVARNAVLVTALFPMSFFFSAVYSESLFLALSVGAVYAARRERWALGGRARRARRGDAQRGRAAARAAADPLPVGHAARCAGAPRRPRARRAVARARAARARRVLRLPRRSPATTRWRRFTPRRSGFAPSPGPFVGAWDGVVAGVAGRAPAAVRRARPGLLHGRRRRSVRRRAPQHRAARVARADASPRRSARCGGCPPPTARTSSRRSRCRCPIRSAPQPLMSLPRFVAVLFPLAIWLALWMTGRAWRERLVLGAFARGPRRLHGDLRDLALGAWRSRHARRARARSSSCCRRRRCSSRELRARGVRGVRGAQAAAALAAEIAFYRAHHDEAVDAASLAALRERCAEVLRDALARAGADVAALGAAASCATRCSRRCAFAPTPRCPDALRALRGAGHRLVVVSNWDVSLHEALRATGLARARRRRDQLGGGGRREARPAHLRARRSRSPARAPRARCTPATRSSTTSRARAPRAARRCSSRATRRAARACPRGVAGDRLAGGARRAGRRRTG